VSEIIKIGNKPDGERQLLLWRVIAVSVLLLASTSGFTQSSSPSFSEIVANATAARDVNDIPRAVELYRQALKINPQWADGWWFIGQLEYSVGEYSTAIDALSHYLELTPNAGPALAIRGLSEFETGDYQKSLNDLQHALSLGAANQSRNEKILRFHESMLLTRLGRFEDAVRSYGLFAQEQANPELLLALGLAGLRTPLLPKDVNTDQQETYRSAGKSALDYMKGDREAAKADFQKLFDQKPPVANAHYLYGFLLYSSEPEEAMVEFKHELEVNPKNSAAQVMRAWIPLLQNDGREALPYAQKAVEQDPSSPSAQLVLGRALTETDNAKDGVEHLEKTEQMQPDNIEVHIALAKAYSKLGRKEDARRERLLCLEMTKLEMTKNETAALHP
jgi:tetratricopeptide (TPR) repeat protein